MKGRPFGWRKYPERDVLASLKNLEVISASDLIDHFSMSRATAHKILRDLEKEGKLERITKQRDFILYKKIIH